MRHLPMIVCLCLGLGAGPVIAGETYDLLFRSGALTNVALAAGGGLDYAQISSGTAAEPVPESFLLALRIEPDDTATLTLHQGDKSRGLGSFPASVGNPVIMYFMETALRDMAEQSGGSPFYIRNRIKEALLGEAEIVPVVVPFAGHDVAAREITIRPFAQDAARSRMGGFADLALAVTVSEDLPGWYYALVATAPAAAGASGEGYSTAITLIAEAKDSQ
ncbi:MAG: hypothetical protein Q8Q26_03220 [Pseudorhodobacter sp.]|nr:hypothetical protein [Pseudorhodobacter sp.]